MNKKGEAFQLLVGLATAIAAVAVILVVTFIIIAQGKTQIASVEGENTTSWNATASINTSVAEGIPPFLPIIIIAGVGAAVIGTVSLFKNR